jgi:ribosomal protein L3
MAPYSESIRNVLYSYGNIVDLLGQRKGNGIKGGNAKRYDVKSVDSAVKKLLGVKGVKYPREYL